MCFQYHGLPLSVCSREPAALASPYRAVGRKKKSGGPKANLWFGGTILHTSPNDGRRHGRLSVAGRLLIAIGVFLLGIYVGSVIHRVVSSRMALQEFDETRAVVRSERGKAPIKLKDHPPIDFSLWAESRILAYGRDLRAKRTLPLAVLRLEKLNLRVPVFEGTDNWTLNGGAGWIKGTARPGEAGNIGIAGHRDSFFRGLKDVHKGDAIELAVAARTATFLVDGIEIVDPEDVTVLEARAAPSLTLVTCYPFYFVGDAPQRFVVHATLSKQAEIDRFWN
jgi:sortase A